MKQEINRLPVSLTRLPPVTERLRMQERDILNKLATFSANSNANGSSDDQKPPNNDPYQKYAHHIGAFVPNISTNITFNANKENSKEQHHNNKANSASNSATSSKVKSDL